MVGLRLHSSRQRSPRRPRHLWRPWQDLSGRLILPTALSQVDVITITHSVETLILERKSPSFSGISSSPLQPRTTPTLTRRPHCAGPKFWRPIDRAILEMPNRIVRSARVGCKFVPRLSSRLFWRQVRRTRCCYVTFLISVSEKESRRVEPNELGTKRHRSHGTFVDKQAAHVRTCTIGVPGPYSCSRGRVGANRIARGLRNGRREAPFPRPGEFPRIETQAQVSGHIRDNKHSRGIGAVFWKIREP